MKVHYIKSLEQYLSLIHSLPETAFFRGVPSEDYSLIPAIGRFYTESRGEEGLKQFERELFEDFKRKYSRFTDVRPRNDKEFLFLAQHYGLPTRLLDWTYNPLIALFFACVSDMTNNGVVYQCFPFSHYLFDEGKDDILTFSYVDILIPKMTDVRYVNQNGLFTLHPNPWKDEISGHVFAKYIIPAITKEQIISKLNTIGLTRSFIFPSLDSLTKEILEIHLQYYPEFKCAVYR